MSSPAVKIADLTDALDLIPDESAAWLDRTTGRVWIIQDHVMAAAESGDPDEAADLSEWEEDEFAIARQFMLGWTAAHDISVDESPGRAGP